MKSLAKPLFFAAELSKVARLRSIAYIISSISFGTDSLGHQIKFKPEIKDETVVVNLTDNTSIHFTQDVTENQIINSLFNNYLAMETDKVINNFK